MDPYGSVVAYMQNAVLPYRNSAECRGETWRRCSLPEPQDSAVQDPVTVRPQAVSRTPSLWRCPYLLSEHCVVRVRDQFELRKVVPYGQQARTCYALSAGLLGATRQQVVSHGGPLRADKHLDERQ